MIQFSDSLIDQIMNKRSCCVVGLDPVYEKIPFVFRDAAREEFGRSFKAVSKSILEFNKAIIDAVYETIPAIKPQIAFYELYGIEGLIAFHETISYAKKRGLIVIEDAKKNDIGNTAQAYSDSHIGRVSIDNIHGQPVFNVDAITVNPYLGSDSIIPFLNNVGRFGKGIFVLVKTSNQSSFELQDIMLLGGQRRVFEHIAIMVDEWGKGHIGRHGYSSVGAVVGATFPEHAKILRRIMPKAIFLVPGYGTQGGTGDDVVACFNQDGFGAVISASRSINYPHGDKLEVTISEFKDLVLNAIRKMNYDINYVLNIKNLIPW